MAVPAPAQEVPAGLSRLEPISVAGKTITLSELEHWAGLARRSSGMPRSRVHLHQAAQVLISQRWIQGEAQAMGIEVTGREVRREFRKQRAASYPSRRAYLRWLRTSGQTQADILLRVRMDILSERISNRAIGGAKDPEEQQRRLDAFVRDYRARWMAVTLCTPRFATVPTLDCGNKVDPVGRDGSGPESPGRDKI